MKKRIPPETVERVRQTISIVEIISEYTDLKKSGKGLRGDCPICKSKNGFTVSPQKSIYKCFVCGAGGNSINFIMKIEDLNYKEAIQFIISKYGKELNIIDEKEALQTKTDLSGLNNKQRQAVISDCKRLLVLAGAGSGKTKTLLQKIIYLIEEKNVNPSNILAITFTKNAATEMLDRLIISADDSGSYSKIVNDKNRSREEVNSQRLKYIKQFKWIDKLTIKTFHSLGYGIMRNYGVSEFDNKFRIITNNKNEDNEFKQFSAQETVFEVMHKLLIQNCENKQYILDLKRYILDYMIDKIHKESEYRLSLPREGKFYTALDGTKIRSKSEQYIADWLYRHSIKFEYEPRVNFKDFDFRPDFYIPEADLYIEHVSNKSYSMKGKEEQFKIANKTLVKTYETQTKDSSLFNLALERIVKNRLPANYQYTSALSFEEEFREYHKNVREFLKQAIRVIDMIKVENRNIDKVCEKAFNDQHERVRNFYYLLKPLIIDYQKYCTNKSYLDFNDILIKTTRLFDNNNEILNKFQSKYKYILVDEFQDVNNLQVELIKKILTPENHLFCVGDDWQSIYGFRGSNINYIIDFRKHFPDASEVKLNRNYRSTRSIVEASNEVIKHNKKRVDKILESSKISNTKIHVYTGKDEDENLDFVINQIKRLQQDKGYTKEDILILYRRNNMYDPYKKRLKEEKLYVSGKTIHGAKGLEANAVFIIGLTEGSGGFPDIWLEDRIFQAIKKSNHDALLEEERRLFYVAITRAKDELFLISELGNESSFLNEIPEVFTYRTNKPFISVIEKRKHCLNCDKQIEEHFIYCPFCGSKQ